MWRLAFEVGVFAVFAGAGWLCSFCKRCGISFDE